MPKPPDDAARFAYADAGRLLRETFDGFLPPLRISVAEHAECHRWVKSTAGPHLERYDHRTAPYLRGPMEALTADGVETVAIVGPASSGKTAGPAESWLLQTMHADPADMLWYMPTEDLVGAYVKGRIEPMLDAHEKLIGELRHGRDSVTMKRFRGGRVEFLPFIHNALVNKHVQRIIADEYDAYDETLGDPLALLNPRRQAAGADSKLLAISHPDLGLPITAPAARQRGIMKLYAASDRRTWWWPCPHCAAFSSPNPGTARRMVLHWPEDAPIEEVAAATRLLCPTCGGLIEDGHRHAMNQAGRWVAQGEEIDEDGRITGRPVASPVAGFWIVGVMSPFVMGGIGALARARVAAERAVTAGGDQRELRSVMVKGWGEPYAAPSHLGSVDAAALAERADERLSLGRVPEGVRFLTAWADAQGNRWEWLVRGWGEANESWIVHHEVVTGDPAASPDDWDGLLARLQLTTFPLADGSGRRMRIRVAGFDVQGQPGVTEQAYAAWLRRRQKGLVRRLGVVEGRDAWDLVPTRGANGKGSPRVSLVYPNSQRRDRKANARGQVPLLLFNPNQAKDALAAQLALAPPAAGAVHFPAALRAANGPPHPFFEGLAAEQRDPGSGAWTKANSAARNEPMDLMVGCEVIARLHGLHRINWERPPAWAAAWETNSMVLANLPASAASPAPEAPRLPPAPLPVAAPPRAALRRRVIASAYMG
jgi:phage terminase large subunit GpA-like protein